MGVASDGSYGIAPGVVFSYPVTCLNGSYSIVQNLDIADATRARIDATNNELREERAGVQELL
jgi:malate dehydrogenase